MKTQIITIALSIIISLSVLTNVGAKANLNTTALPVANVEMNLNTLEEEELNVENWMTSEKLWSVPAKSSVSIINEEIEEPLEIETWMFDEDLWKKEKPRKTVYETILNGDKVAYEYRQKTIKEKSMEIEPWMTCDRYWKFDRYFYASTNTKK